MAGDQHALAERDQNREDARGEEAFADRSRDSGQALPPSENRVVMFSLAAYYFVRSQQPRMTELGATSIWISNRLVKRPIIAS